MSYNKVAHSHGASHTSSSFQVQLIRAINRGLNSCLVGQRLLLMTYTNANQKYSPMICATSFLLLAQLANQKVSCRAMIKPFASSLNGPKLLDSTKQTAISLLIRSFTPLATKQASSRACCVEQQCCRSPSLISRQFYKRSATRRFRRFPVRQLCTSPFSIIQIEPSLICLHYVSQSLVLPRFLLR